MGAGFVFNPDLGHLLLLRLERHQVNRKGASQFIKHHLVKKTPKLPGLPQNICFPGTLSITSQHLVNSIPLHRGMGFYWFNRSVDICSVHLTCKDLSGLKHKLATMIMGCCHCVVKHLDNCPVWCSGQDPQAITMESPIPINSIKPKIMGF